MEELEDAVGLGGDDADVDLDEETIAKLFRLHQEKEKIRQEAENLENPLLRKAERVSKVAQRRLAVLSSRSEHQRSRYLHRSL